MDAKQSLGEPRLLISRSALLRNARLLRNQLSDGTKICAIVKADAYGHGAAIVADVLSNFSDVGSGASVSASPQSPVDSLAVASLDEAADLPEQALPILVLRPLENTFLGRQRAKLEQAIRAGWTLTVCTAAAANDAARIAIACGRRLPIQIMVDTGLTRSGICPSELSALIHKIESRPSLKLVGLYTHFSDSEQPDSETTAEQLGRFLNATDAYARFAGPRLTRHAANSGGIFFSGDSHLDMVRPGLSLYGLDPTGRPSQDRPLRPVMRWTAPLVGIREIARGTCVGYGQSWQAERDTRIGLVPVGYADGYPRQFSGRAVVMLHGRAARVVGRISMDLTTIDLGDCPQATIGDEVTLLDNDPLSPASAYALAGWADTIPYEIISRIGQRVARVAIDPEDPADSIWSAASDDASA